MSAARQRTLWVGPIAFAAVMLCIVGLFNVVTGLTAVTSDEITLGTEDLVVILDVTAWGWVHLLLGVLLFLTGLAVLLGQTWGRVVAVALLAVNMVTQVVLVEATPYASLAVIGLEVVVIWALIVHGDEVDPS
ncbi:DUF7144 family membrane protein [Nocardioides sambongensis]|uniref:DUF7144 family membrane protein n=1 Tax=Nocardioides sambongensis TaxID=2589074 RepID=UPI0018C89AFF|nr:hypothetical protein [Nocardioides sambongensis]